MSGHSLFLPKNYSCCIISWKKNRRLPTEFELKPCYDGNLPLKEAKREDVLRLSKFLSKPENVKYYKRICGIPEDVDVEVQDDDFDVEEIVIEIDSDSDNSSVASN